MKPSIILPNRTGTGANETLQSDHNIVIIGANGSGKTRLGAWIETALQNQISVHRISAQRALNIPEHATIRNLEQAEKGLFFGREDQHASALQKNASRWGHNPNTHLLNDYEVLLSTLFAKVTRRDREHTRETKEKQVYIPVADSPIDTIIHLWKEIFPHREISFEDGKVYAKKEGHTTYHGKEMSDGERVSLYLIGQCICAPDNSIVIIDEPEIHVHKSLMGRLWNKIEEVCPNKLFVFITHDLDFASSRKEAKKLWIKSFDGAQWIWDEVPTVDEIPENLAIEIVGNRKNIIFTEGEKASYDNIIYQAAFNDFHVIPRGSCEKVIESTKAIRGTPSLHHLKAFGIIDSDYRTNEEINALKDAGIFTINVAEVENLFCIEPLLRIVAENQMLDPDTIVKNVTTFIIDALKNEFDVQVSNRAEREIQFKLGAYTKIDHSEKGLKDGLDKILTAINLPQIYEDSKLLYEEAVKENSIEKALRIYNRKNLPSRISKEFGLNNGEYIKIIFRLLKSDKKKDIISAIKKYTPTIE